MASLFPADRLFLIAGPCQLEDDALNLRVAEHLAKLADKVPGGVVFKASFDKANRSNAGATRGPGLDAGLEQLRRVREASGLAVLTTSRLGLGHVMFFGANETNLYQEASRRGTTPKVS